MDFQSLAALTIVLITAAVMVYVKVKKKSAGCGGGCCPDKSIPAGMPTKKSSR